MAFYALLDLTHHGHISVGYPLDPNRQGELPDPDETASASEKLGKKAAKETGKGKTPAPSSAAEGAGGGESAKLSAKPSATEEPLGCDEHILEHLASTVAGAGDALKGVGRWHVQKLSQVRGPTSINTSISASSAISVCVFRFVYDSRILTSYF